MIDLELLSPEVLPIELAVSAITMAELATGPEAAADPDERARRIALIQPALDRAGRIKELLGRAERHLDRPAEQPSAHDRYPPRSSPAT